MSIKNNTVALQSLLEAVNALPEAVEQATPVISVNTSGLITATAGTKTSTHQLAFQPAKTITPSTVSQIAVPSGYYTGGDITVAGDSNLVASNIKSGVSIFGVSGTLEEGSGGSGEQAEWSANEDAMVAGTLSNYFNDRVTTIDNYAFYNCSRLTTVSFPACTTIGNNAFYNCSRLTTVSFPACTTIGNNAFYGCYNLKSLYLTGFSLCKLSNSNTFSSTPIGGYSVSAGTYGSIYVPASLLTSYQTATNWTYFSSRFVALGSEDNNNLITFTIEGTEYQAEDGMTWGDWVNSEYNTGGFYISNDSLLNSNKYAVYDNTTEVPCSSYEVIRPNEEYV